MSVKGRWITNRMKKTMKKEEIRNNRESSENGRGRRNNIFMIQFLWKKDKNGTHFSQVTDHKLKTTKYCIKNKK